MAWRVSVIVTNLARCVGFRVSIIHLNFITKFAISHKHPTLCCECKKVIIKQLRYVLLYADEVGGKQFNLPANRRRSDTTQICCHGVIPVCLRKQHVQKTVFKDNKMCIE